MTVGDAELTWHAVDTKHYNVNLYHFAHALGKPTSDVLFWAVTIVNCPQEMHGVRLAIGSNAASVWWVNGKEVIGIYGDRQTVIDDGVSKRLTLKKGPNIVRAAIVNGGGATDFCARFLDAEDKPLKGFTVSLVERSKVRRQRMIMTRIRTRFLFALLAAASFGFAQRGPDRPATHLCALPRQRHLRCRRNRWLDSDARSGHAHLRLQVDDSPQ